MEQPGFLPEIIPWKSFLFFLFFFVLFLVLILFGGQAGS